MRLSPELADFDFFAKQKREAFYGSLEAVLALLAARDCWPMTAHSSDTLVGLLKISLWGNKCDLSISAGATQNSNPDPLSQVQELKSNPLVDDSQRVAAHLLSQQGSPCIIVDIVMDNAGFELISDLVLADYLVSVDLVDK